MSQVSDTEQCWYGKLRTTKVWTHKGFHRVKMVTKDNVIIKDIVTVFNNHPEKCKCGWKKSQQLVFNYEEIRRTS